MDFDSIDNDSGNDAQDPSGTHIYFYQRGHERLPGDEGDKAYEALANAYELAKTKPTKGKVRSFADSQYSGGFVHLLADFTLSMGEAVEERSAKPLLDFALADLPTDQAIKAISAFLDENPDVKKGLIKRMKEDQQAASADD